MRDAEKVAPIWLGESPVSLRNVCGHRQGRPIQWIREKTVATWNPFGVTANCVGDIGGILVDKQFLEADGRGRGKSERGE